MLDLLTCSFPSRVSIAEDQKIIGLLAFNVVPTMPLVRMQKLVFPNSVHVNKVCDPDVVLGINGSVIADC